jgi:uncharacterized C2H2 Zn-finger protein
MPDCLPADKLQPDTLLQIFVKNDVTSSNIRRTNQRLRKFGKVVRMQCKKSSMRTWHNAYMPYAKFCEFRKAFPSERVLVRVMQERFDLGTFKDLVRKEEMEAIAPPDRKDLTFSRNSGVVQLADCGILAEETGSRCLLKCVECSDTFMTGEELKCHLRESHANKEPEDRASPSIDKVFPCLFCAYSSVYENVNAHMIRTHADELFSDFQCPAVGCEEMFKAKIELFLHLNASHDFLKLR